MLLIAFTACETSPSIPDKAIQIDPSKEKSSGASELDILVFKKEKKVEMWEFSSDFSLNLLQKYPLNKHFKLPIGHFLSESGNMELDLPGSFYSEKLKLYSEFYLTQTNFSTRKVDIIDLLPKQNQASIIELLKKYKLRKVLIFPNDARKNPPLEVCIACPHWMAEIYGELAIWQKEYKI